MQIKIICPQCVKIIDNIETTKDGIKSYIEKSEEINCPMCGSGNYELCFLYPHVEMWCEDCSTKYMCSTTNNQQTELISLIIRELATNEKHSSLFLQCCKFLGSKIQ